MIKIMLVCSAGMSTSLLVNKMLDAAKKQGMETEIFAVPEVEIKQYIDKADVVLLAPQVRFLYNKMLKELEPTGIPLAIIDSVSYGLMNGDAVIKQVADLVAAGSK
ncbi:MAG: PTS sugar transporter subunit IIB [Bacillota bacterium]